MKLAIDKMMLLKFLPAFDYTVAYIASTRLSILKLIRKEELEITS